MALAPPDAPRTAHRVLREANADDLALANSVQSQRLERLEACERLFGDGIWPLALVDVEPLLDDARTVLYYLGPHGLDDAGLREVLRRRYGLEIVLEPVGRDEPVAVEAMDDDAGGCGSCGSGSGCGTSSDGEEGSKSKGGGCSGCSVKSMVRARKPRFVPAT